MWYSFIKRAIDLSGAFLGLVISSPIFLIISLAIKITSPGPILADSPERVGKEGRVFKMYKFRSMIKNAHNLLRTDPRFKKHYQQYKENSFKLRTDSDPRITSVGKIIRRTSLDELPQFINILKGDMSLVGPRAFHIDELEEQSNKFSKTKELVKQLLTIRPGLTGPWQVSGRSAINFPERVKLDAEYVGTRSLLNDIKILLKTIPAIFKGEGN